MAAADTTALGTPIADGGIAAVNFFNGRLLTGKDLSREQDARRQADQRVGQAMGPGIAWGLEVSALQASPASNSQVRVSEGVGVSPSGQVLKLAGDTVASLVPPESDNAAATPGVFGACLSLGGGSYVAGDGLYLLTLAPKLKADGTAPVLALDSVNLRCSTDAWIEAVQLRLLAVGGWTGQGEDRASLAYFRNAVAHAYLGSAGAAAAHARPGTAAAAGTLSCAELTPCDLPLALVYMVGSEIRFIEAWAVRRRIAADAASAPWAPWLGERQRAWAEARLLQFQAQLVDEGPSILAGPASDSLRWLPPAGFLPQGTVAATFLGSRVAAPAMPLAPADAPAVLARALAGDAIDLKDAADKSRLRLYALPGTGGLLFVRDARNVHAAEQVWLDGARAGLPGVADVQDAIDTLRKGSCLHVVLRPPPSMSAEALLKAIPVGKEHKGDVTLCFEPGEYRLKAPLKLTGFGQVLVRGHGAKLVAKDECALQVIDCTGVVVQDIGVAGSSSGTGKDDAGLGTLGALTIVDCGEVRIEHVHAECAPSTGEKPQAAGIVVGYSASALEARTVAPRVTVAGCQVDAGARQYGVLVTNAGVARLQRNTVGALKKGEALAKGVVVAGETAELVQVEDNVVTDAICGIAIGLSKSETKAGEPLQAERVVVSGNHTALRLTEAMGIDRYGIFVGNAKSALVTGNRVTANPREGELLELQGLRLAGAYGPQLIVRDNLVEGATFGIRFQPAQEARDALRVFQFNVLVGGDLVVDLTKSTSEVLVVEHNVKVKPTAPAA